MSDWEEKLREATGMEHPDQIVDEVKPSTKFYYFTSDERPLPDDYPVYYGYVYIIGGVFKRSYIQGTVRQLKVEHGVSEVRNCNLFAHEGARLGDRIGPKPS